MDLLGYLQGLAPVKLARLYDSAFTCQAVLSSLPPLAKQYVLRLLYVDGGVPQGGRRLRQQQQQPASGGAGGRRRRGWGGRLPLHAREHARSAPPFPCPGHAVQAC